MILDEVVGRLTSSQPRSHTFTRASLGSGSEGAEASEKEMTRELLALSDLVVASISSMDGNYVATLSRMGEQGYELRTYGAEMFVSGLKRSEGILPFDNSGNIAAVDQERFLNEVRMCVRYGLLISDHVLFVVRKERRQQWGRRVDYCAWFYAINA